jgi:hypothetical protein
MATDNLSLDDIRRHIEELCRRYEHAENFITAPVFEHDPITGEKKRNLGSFQFVQLPAPGDRFTIPRDGWVDGKEQGPAAYYRVLYVGHEPMPEGQRAPPGQCAAFVHVEFMGEYW